MWSAPSDFCDGCATGHRRSSLNVREKLVKSRVTRRRSNRTAFSWHCIIFHWHYINIPLALHQHSIGITSTLHWHYINIPLVLHQHYTGITCFKGARLRSPLRGGGGGAGGEDGSADALVVLVSFLLLLLPPPPPPLPAAAAAVNIRWHVLPLSARAATRQECRV
jgi:hypothetical protein